MKTIKKISAVVITALLGILMLTGCGANEYVGKWEAKSLTMSGQTYEGDVDGTPVAVAFQIEFKEGGEGELLIAGKDNAKIKWEADGDTLTADSGDGSDKLTFTKDGEELKAQQGTLSVVLVKVDDFTPRSDE